jgi:1,2-diacylglycerol 3-beta-galactosyltransferase
MIMSVHPILQSAPRATSSHLKNGRRIPFVTVVTDLGEAHPWWFNKGLDRLFVPTEVMRDQGVHLYIYTHTHTHIYIYNILSIHIYIIYNIIIYR